MCVIEKVSTILREEEYIKLPSNELHQIIAKRTRPVWRSHLLLLFSIKTWPFLCNWNVESLKNVITKRRPYFPDFILKCQGIVSVNELAGHYMSLLQV